jgi:hypothetical protein
MLAPALLTARRALACAAVACGAVLAAVPSSVSAAVPESATGASTAAAVADAASATAAPRAAKRARRAAKRARRASRAASARRAGRTARSARGARSARRTRASRRARSTWTAADVAELSAGGATLRGSKAAVEHAYDEARSEGLQFTASRSDVLRGVEAGDYVSLRGGVWRLKGVTMPYARPETRAFLLAFAPEYEDACGEPLTVTSAMRPTSVRLRNSVAKTVHPTGIAVDLRAPRSRCRSWMRAALLGYERRGVVEATEERRPAHFHVAVLRAP